MNNLQYYSVSKYYSQNGEDGILEEILKRLKRHINLDGWCSELGALDGVHLSNTCYLIKNMFYKSVLIEGDISKFKKLNKNFPSDDQIKVCRFVSFESENSLDSIYSETPIPKNFDFLSIDVDGVDYYIFESLKRYKPKIVCIEFNPHIPNSVDYVQPKEMRIKHGNSAKALIRLAHQKGYSLVASTNTNLIFCDSAFSDYVVETIPSLDDINPGGGVHSETIIFSGYDGSILSNKEYILLPWHGVPVPIAKLQFLPKFMRKFKGDYGILRNLFFNFLVVFRLPKQILKYRQKVIAKLKQELKRLLSFK